MLGRAAPPSCDQLQVEAAAVAMWERRWMSLSVMSRQRGCSWRWGGHGSLPSGLDMLDRFKKMVIFGSPSYLPGSARGGIPGTEV